MATIQDLIGIWSADAIYGPQAQADEWLVFKPDGEGYLEVNHFGTVWAELFQWSLEAPYLLRLKGLCRFGTNQETPPRLEEHPSNLDGVFPVQIQMENVPAGPTIPILRFTQSPWFGVSDHFGFHRRDITGAEKPIFSWVENPSTNLSPTEIKNAPIDERQNPPIAEKEPVIGAKTVYSPTIEKESTPTVSNQMGPAKIAILIIWAALLAIVGGWILIHRNPSEAYSAWNRKMLKSSLFKEKGDAMLKFLKYPTTPENAPKFAADIVAIAAETHGLQLDYSVASLEKVDALLEKMRREGCDSDELSAALFGLGCYVGEVFVQSAGGQWRNASETPMSGAAHPLIIELGNKKFCNPIEKVFKRLDNGEEDSITYFYQIFAEPK